MINHVTIRDDQIKIITFQCTKYICPGFAAEWSLSWLSLSNQYLRYTTLDPGSDMEDINLKKTKDLFIRVAYLKTKYLILNQPQ